MNAFISWVLKNRLLIVIATAVAIVLGAIAWARLPIDAFPDVTNTQVMIISKAPGLAAEDVEQQVSYPIEQAMGGLPHVTLVRSLSRAELSQVVVIFEDGAETYWTRQVVFERLADVRETLPPGVEPELGPISTGLGEIFQYTVEGEGFSPMELRTIQDWIVAPMLRPIPGVNEVNSFGGHVKQYQVLLHPERLLKYDLTLDEVAEAIEAGNGNAAGGVIVRGWEQSYLRGVGLLRDIDDIGKIVLKAADGAPIRVADIADVTIGAQPRQGGVSRDGRGEVVAGMVIMLKGENSRDVVNRVKDAMARIGDSLPRGVRINVFYDRTSLIEACIATVMNALVEGGVFVILVLFLFLAEFRTALIVVFSLPLTFLVSFIVMGTAGISSNLMSLGGLAFSVGMVVDASIVVVENIRRKLAALADPRGRHAAVVEAVAEVASPVAFSVLIIAVILVPLYSLQGVEGKMFGPLVSTMMIAILVSLVVALTVVPALGEWFLRAEPEREFGVIRRLHAAYRQLLDRAIARPKTTIGGAAVVMALAVVLTPWIGAEFMPALDEGAIAINAVRLPNASLDGSVRVADFIEKRLAKFPEVETVVSKTGRAEISEDPMGPEQSDIFVMLKPRKQWGSGRDRAALVEDIGRDLATIPGIRLSFSQPIALRVNELISGVKSDLAVKVFGPDLNELKTHADRVASVLTGMDGATDVKIEQITGTHQWDLIIRRDAAARFGIRVADINTAIETAVAGRDVTTLIEGQRRFAVTVRFPEAARRDMDAIGDLLIPAPGGQRVPLSRLVEVRETEAPAQISREQGMRRVVVEANIRGRDLGGFVAEAEAKLEPIRRSLPAGYTLQMGGQFENQQRATRQLSVVVPVALILILVLLYLALRSISHSLLVLLNLPFALVGGVIAVVLFRMDLSVSAYIAFIVLLGIAVQNGVVLMDFIVRLRRSGADLNDAVTLACALRFRPLLMTALTSFIGHLPMLYATGSGADIQKPLAVVVMGGIVTSTALTLVVLPSVYCRLQPVIRTHLEDETVNPVRDDR